MSDHDLNLHHARKLQAMDHLRQAANLTSDPDVKRMARALRDYLGSGLMNEDEYSVLGDEIETAAHRLVRECRNGAGAA